MDNDELPETIDLEALDLGPMADRARKATFAPNWKSVLAADASIGLVLVVLGALVQLRIVWLGWLLVAVGVLYVLLVGRRFLQWRWLRGQAGLR